MDKKSAVKAITLLLSASLVLVPIIYALNEYNWDVQALITPSYTPPKVDFRMEPSGVKLEGGQLRATFKLINLGEVEVIFESLNAAAYGPDGQALASATLDKGVVSHPNSTEVLILNVDKAALNKLMPYFKDRDRIKIEVKGEALVRVFGSKVIVPISLPFEISLTDIKGGKH
jgi:LEA14-like dessication related protein